MKNKQYQKAVDLYSEAIKIDHSSAVYIANRSAALMMVEKFKDAREDAMIATLLDPNYGKSWARLGIAELKLGNGKKARDAYQRAIEVAGSEITKSMEQGLANANAKNEADTNAIENEPNRAAKDVLRRKYEDQDWDIVGKVPEFHSHVHQQQVEGLLLFAERIKWPYFNEVRYYAEDVYGNLRSGLDIPVHLHDWFYGITLPGAWMSFKIMTALIQCTPSISTEFFPSPAEYQPRHVRLHARRVAPFEYAPKSDDGVTYIGPRHTRFEATKIRPDEEAQSYLAEMKDPDSWVVPEPPVRQVSDCAIHAIQLKKMPLDNMIIPQRAQGGISARQVDALTPYRAKDIDDGVMVINATGQGAEALARAWCSERGKNAIIRRSGGPCYVCAVKAADKAGLGHCRMSGSPRQRGTQPTDQKARLPEARPPARGKWRSIT
ncbi:MAG: hypothetical protein M1832_000616 [Thelocarpon impressellum]|nr:MAG: hypothetical protein M1832_000616 [Thelocarpon impressellum]